jgi:2-polyprenyl-6-methoxyphenol hydroxylase-like FAD-dependent oxidoreductase
MPRHTMPIQLYTTPTEAIALWVFPAAPGHKAVTLRARVPLAAIRSGLTKIAQAQLPEGSAIDVGFKISFKSLGRSLVKIGKSKAFRALLVAAGDAAKMHPAIAANPAAMAAINAGQAAVRIKAKADAGDPQAKQIVARALEVANGTVPPGAPVAAPGSPIRRMQRYIVTLGLEPAPGC